MIHKMEWITCDRCGTEIKDMDKLHFTHIFKKLPIKFNTETIHPYILNTEILKDCAIPEMKLTILYKSEDKKFYLCGKCRKKLEKFMKMED